MVTLTKEELLSQNLKQYVIPPSEEDFNFDEWWKSLLPDEEIDVQYPHNQHGLARKPSNHAKPSELQDFLDFVDNNSAPNGRQAGSYSAQFYFLPKLQRIEPPKSTEKNHDMKAQACHC